MDKFQLAATVDRLIYEDDDTFKADDAIALLAELPKPTWRQFLPHLIFRMSTVGKSAQGFAAGVGNASIREEGGSFEFDSRGAARVGQWKLRRTWRSIEIEQMASDESDEGRSALVRFSVRWMPLSMDILVQKEISLAPFCSVVFGRYVPWKSVQ